MRKIPIFLILLLAFLPIGLAAQNASKPKQISITAYNENFALVRDLRTINLSQGINSIDIEDVAAKIDPTSILFKSLTAPNAVSILEQNYQYDLINPQNILNKSVGQRVTFTNFDETGKPYTQSGILLSPPSNGGVVIRTDDGKVVLSPYGQQSIDKTPDGLHPKPTLNWLLNSSKAGEQQAEISYITEGIGWKADYVALVNKNDTALDLAGWVTLNNQSGASYDNAKLTLMAGDVRRVQEAIRTADGRNYGVLYEIEAKPQFQEKSFFEYHMYTMDRPTTIRDNETKQLSLLNAANAPIKKEFIYNCSPSNKKTNVVLEVKNSKENHMGMPLPNGKIRVYKLDDTGSQQFIGEAMIDHTPKDEKVRLYIGDAFDVVGEYKPTEVKRISKNLVETSYEVRIRNHKSVAVEVSVVDHLLGSWEIIKGSHKYNKKDASTIEIPVTVPADGEKVITYTVRVKQ